MPLPLLWHSNAPWAPTGYGNQTGLFAPLLKPHYDVAISAFYGLQGAPLVWDDIRVLPGVGGDYANAYLTEHAKRHFAGGERDGMVVTLMDVWVLEVEVCKGLNMASWCPVDHEPVPPRVIQFFKDSGAVPIAMSRFGQRELAKVGFRPLYVPHGVDTEIFQPYPRDEIRKLLGAPEDAFLVGMVAANKGAPSRKGFQHAFNAFAELRRQHENACLYLHTTVSGDYARGENLGAMLEAAGVPNESVFHSDQYAMMLDPISSGMMARLYSAMDVLVNPAKGEGFGIPVLEAQACGIPVIVTDFSAMPEVGPVGWHVGYERDWTLQNSWQANPSTRDVYEALEACYGRSDAEVEDMAGRAREHALGYHAPVVLEEFMLPALEESWKRLTDRFKPSVEVMAA